MYSQIHVYSNADGTQVLISSSYGTSRESASRSGFPLLRSSHQVLSRSEVGWLIALPQGYSKGILERLYGLLVEKIALVLHQLTASDVYALSFGDRPQFLENILFDASTLAGKRLNGKQQRCVQLADIVHNFGYWHGYDYWDEESARVHQRHSRVDIPSVNRQICLPNRPIPDKKSRLNSINAERLLVFPTEVSAIPSASGMIMNRIGVTS
jgi:hypothetical protein